MQTATPEQLFRSVSLILFSNASDEYAFVSALFGRPAEVPVTSEATESEPSPSVSRALSPDLADGNRSSSHVSSIHDDETASVTSGDVSYVHSGQPIERQAKLQRQLADHVWKQVFEPSLEYGKVRLGMLFDNDICTELGFCRTSSIASLLTVRVLHQFSP